MGARRHLEAELEQLLAQRERYVKAARVGSNRAVVLRHLLNAERLGEEIQALEAALASLSPEEPPPDETTVVFRASSSSRTP